MLIGEVARRSGVSARMLRHYESLGLVRPSVRTGSGYREYSAEDIRRIFHVESLRSLGLSLREVARALDDPGFRPSALVDDLVRQTRARIAEETALLTRLRRIGAADPDDWEDVLQTVALLHALGSESAGRRQRAALSSAGQDPVPVEALVEAVLHETDPNAAGALRWALARAGGQAAALLADGLASPVAEVRERAVLALAEIPGDEATALLRSALGEAGGEPEEGYGGGCGAGSVVARHAALALGVRGVAAAVPVLVDMVVRGTNDVDAADALSALAGDPDLAEEIAAGLAGRLARGSLTAHGRHAVAQALAGIEGATSSRALAELARDEDRAVALTASYVLRLRGSR
ncbi:MerR family transcriptional regulator [Streptomyces sp. PsTaAH-124]|uniref:MerR family transcriptional regulator n=1 Tax=Streptomyces sp. PsTaAH-124 TaxID=1157638 RepID=UPI00036427AB|nr:MerR family transcriptional regulator [Streptomyces sp. PsTaAH-124]